jgi:hypothetical protein
MPNPSEEMIKTLITDLKKAKVIVDRIDDLKDKIKDERANHPALNTVGSAEAEYKKYDDLAKKMSSKTTKEDAYKATRKALTTFIASKKLEKREAALKQALVQAKSWTVTVVGAVDGWVSSHSAGSQFDKLQDDIRKNGVKAGGLRKVGSAYDWHVPGAGDYRVVGEANEADHEFEFKGVYEHHPKGSGKKLVVGESASGY